MKTINDNTKWWEKVIAILILSMIFYIIISMDIDLEGILKFITMPLRHAK